MFSKKSLFFVMLLAVILSLFLYLPFPTYAQTGPAGSYVNVGIKVQTPTTLFGGVISTSLAESSVPSSSVIDMTQYTSGTLQFTVASGTGTWSLAVYGKETNSGVFLPVEIMKSDYSGWVAYPAVTTTASTSQTFVMKDIRCRYLKFVPTLSGSGGATFLFTPSK